MSSVLQDWVMELNLREQGTLLTAVRGCDLAPKEWDSDGNVIDTPERHLTAFIRYCFMVPADPREVGLLGAFMQNQPPNSFKPSAFGHYPMHWYSHVMHALEVIAFQHPDWITREQALKMYDKMVENLHLKPESRPEMIERLSEDRIVKGNVVS